MRALPTATDTKGRCHQLEDQDRQKRLSPEVQRKFRQANKKYIKKHFPKGNQELEPTDNISYRDQPDTVDGFRS